MGVNYDQCLAELKNNLEGKQGYDTAKSVNGMAKLLTMIHGANLIYLATNIR